MASIKPITEEEFTSQVLEYAKLRGWRTAHFRPARTAKGWRTAVSGDGKGFPDLIMLRSERLLVAELKVGRNKGTHEQHAWIKAFSLITPDAYFWYPEHWDSIEYILK
jgi:hypothetical protein